MTIRILNATPNSETANAEAFREALLASQPTLEHPDISVEILCNLHLAKAQIDLALIYHDARPERLRLTTQHGHPIHSFVMTVEIKRHPPDLVRFAGDALEVRYDGQWSNATDQADRQRYAFRDYQAAPYQGAQRRYPTFTHAMIWLPQVPAAALDEQPNETAIPVQFATLDWNRLTGALKKNQNQVRSLSDTPAHPDTHSLQTLRDLLHRKVNPTRLDLRRVNALTQTRFDAEKTAYIQNLGTGLLLLRGRAGTGKTFALMQIALHLAKQGKRTAVITYNHGLIADIDRALHIIAARGEGAKHMPEVQTRYAFLQDAFIRTFGDAAEQTVRDNISKIADREEHRLHRLLTHTGPIRTTYDHALIDEGQDWSPAQRDLIYRIFGPERVIVADGVDQFVDRARCTWDTGTLPINRRHRLRASRRTKSATCQTIAEVARELKLTQWDVQPDPEVFGGRITVLVEPNPWDAVRRGLDLIEDEEREDPRVKPVDSLLCLPSPKMARGVNYEALFDRVTAERNRDSWRGFSPQDRRNYPTRPSQLRAVQYHSCRGMEGWTTLCLGLDSFFDFQRANPQIDTTALSAAVREREGLFAGLGLMEAQLAEEAESFAVNWLMIALTRSIDHMVIHVTDRNSRLGLLLARVSRKLPGAIEWIDGPQQMKFRSIG